MKALACAAPREGRARKEQGDAAERGRLGSRGAVFGIGVAEIPVASGERSGAVGAERLRVRDD
jgi:hypothetical protein